MRYIDLGIIALYLIGITWFGARFKESQKSLKDYFLGGRNTPWWAIGFSIVSAETSTLTVIGTPALSFYGNFGLLQVVMGYLLARIVISFLFLPHYFRGELYTAYELMQRRFGPRLRRLTAGTFLLLRALAEGVRVFAISIVISIILGTGEIASIVVIVCLTLFYTFEGGMTAVIWTDVVQMFLYVSGALVSLFVILHQIPGGWSEVAQAAAAAGKFQVFDFRFEPTLEFFSRTYSFWAGILGGCFLTTASHGTEQLMVQRLLSARNEGDARKALFASWIVIFFQFALFLVIGVILWVYYANNGMQPPKPADRIYPQFIWSSLPVGVAGLVIAAILAAAMSNLSAALNALASTSIMDFYKPKYPNHEESHYLRLAKLATLAWGAVLFVIGVLARSVGSVLEAGLGIASILYGALLGVFLVGVLTKRAGERAAMAGMVAGIGVNLFVRFGTTIAWTWYVLIGTVVTAGVTLLVSAIMREEKRWPA
ncbi:MAG: sodium/solute symporter [Candidatus Solibacter usitatus]|nr:sodium/solute symporter [Candidatus Solibacter usitatus]